MHKNMSLQQIDANQRNAQKSTGPKTPEGRAVSKMNALKHGILSRQVLVRGLNIKESSRKLSALHDRFRRDLNPVGPVEEMLVDQIVTTHWRLRRALSAESGEIALSVDECHWKRRFNPTMFSLQLKMADDPMLALQDSALGNSSLASRLRELRDGSNRKGN